MNERKPLAFFLGENPTRAIEWPLWFVLFFAGLYLLSPWYDVTGAAGTNGALVNAIASVTAFKVYGSLIFGTGALGLAGLLSGISRLRKWAAHILFFVFLYFTLLRILIIGPINLGWITYFFNTLLAAAVILRIRWEELDRGGTLN